jgi:hypothetical protein
MLNLIIKSSERTPFDEAVDGFFVDGFFVELFFVEFSHSCFVIMN